MQQVGMETKFAKVLDSAMLGDVDLKRRRTDNGESYFSGAAGMAVPLRCAPNSSPRSLVKRQKLDGPRRTFPSFSFNRERSLQRYYLNFKNSGPPQRVMYSENGVWVDLPHDAVALIKKEMQTKNAMMEMNIDGDLFLLDFSRMIRMHLDTGVQQPIAWIDEAGSCYFPGTFADDNFDDCSPDYGSDNDHLVTEHHGSNDLKLKLEIEISGSDIFNLKESTGESNAIAAHIRVSRKSAEERFDAEDVISSVRENEHAVEDCEESKRMVDVPKKIIPKVEHLDADAVKEMFSRGIGSFVGGEIVALHCGSSAVAEGRRELFQKQVDIVKRLRGDANIHYAWLPFPKGEVYSAMNYGLGCHTTSNIMSTYGIGVHLIPVSCTNISESLFDVDENGVGNVLLCRVIMGTMEHVQPASKQFHPSSDDYDSGVDDPQNPNQYIVWSMNMNTHIYPEFAVTFKIPSDSKAGPLNGNRMDVSGVTNCSQVLHAQSSEEILEVLENLHDVYAQPLSMKFYSLQLVHALLNGGSCPQVSTENTQGKSPSHIASRPVRLPKSPWMPFPVLIDAISSKVSEKEMHLVNRHYRLYQNKLISRVDFITKLRLAVGDTLLKSTLTSLQNKVPSQSQTGLVMPREPGKSGGF